MNETTNNQNHNCPLGRYGRLRRGFLQETNLLLFHEMLLNGSLYPHLYQIEEQANRLHEQIMSELLRRNPPPDKKNSQMEWVQHMNSLQAQTEEIVMQELILN